VPKVASAPHHDSLSGSPEKRYDIAPDGGEHLLVVAPYRATFLRSVDGGSVFNPFSSFDLGQDTAVPSFVIGDDGTAFVSYCQWNRDPQVIKLRRGRQTSTGWQWSEITLAPGGRVGVDTDLIVFRQGAGYVVFVYWTAMEGGYVARVDVSSDGTMRVTSLRHGTKGGRVAGLIQMGSLEFAHSGDGKTPSSAPHLFCTTAASNNPLYVHRARFESAGVWTWEDPVVVETNVSVNQTAMTTVWDGERLCIAYVLNNSSTIRFAEWSGSGAVTFRNPPAFPSGRGVVPGITISHDPATDDIYLLAYGSTQGDIMACRLNRASATWDSAWTTAVTRPASTADGKVNAVRHPSRDSVQFAWATPGGAGWDVYASQLTALVRTPQAPVLLDPPSGATRDLAAGYTFRHRYQPVGPGDKQQGYYWRRQYTSGGSAITEWWNAASQSWSSTAVLNTGETSAVSFAPGKWSNGSTYTWSVAARSLTGSVSPYSAPRTVVATTAPALTITEPLGIVFGTTTPAVAWTVGGPDPQRDYRVRIVPDAANVDANDPGPAIWDSGVIASALARRVVVGTDLTPNVAYRAWVRVTSTAGIASAWVSSPFLLNLNPPNGPLVEVVDEVAYGTEVPRVRLDLLARSNLMGEDQALGQAGWLTDNASVAPVGANTTSQTENGVALTSAAGGAMSMLSALGTPPAAPPGRPQPLGPLFFPAVPGQTYTAMAHGRSPDNNRALRVSIHWFSDDTAADGALPGSASYITTAAGEQFNIGAAAYNQARLSARAPATARMGRVVVEVLGVAAAGEVVYLSRFAVQPGASTAWQPGGYTGGQVLVLERSDDDGEAWRQVGERIKPDVYQRAVTRDRSMPMGRRVLYRASTVVDVYGASGVSTLRSVISPVAAINLAGPTWIMRDLTNESDDGEVLAFVTDWQEEDEEEVAIHKPTGRFYPVVDSEGEHAGSGSMTFYVPAALVAKTTRLLTSGNALLMQSPLGRVLMARFSRREYEPEVVGARTITADYVEVER